MTFEQELTNLLNRNCMESASNTPDFILAQYLQGCLAAYNTAVQQRETWYGRDARPSFSQTRVLTAEEADAMAEFLAPT